MCGTFYFLTDFIGWPQISGVGQDVARMWEMAIQHALMPAVSTGVSHSSHRSGHSKTTQILFYFSRAIGKYHIALSCIDDIALL